jgi:hypothetical protein
MHRTGQSKHWLRDFALANLDRYGRERGRLPWLDLDAPEMYLTLQVAFDDGLEEIRGAHAGPPSRQDDICGAQGSSKGIYMSLHAAIIVSTRCSR